MRRSEPGKEDWWDEQEAYRRLTLEKAAQSNLI